MVVFGEIAIEGLEGFGVAGIAHHSRNLLARGPDVFQIHRPFLALAQWLGLEILLHRAGNGIGHHQRRRGQEVGPQVRMDACFEVSVAGEHGRADQVVGDNRFIEGLGEVPRVANAGGAAVGRHMEAQLLQVGQQACLGEVVGHHTAAGRKRSLHPRVGRQPGLHRLLGHKARREQHAGVGGVRAGGDGGNQDIAMAQVGLTGGNALGELGCGLGKTILGHGLGEEVCKGPLHAGEFDAVLGTLGARQRGLDAAQIEADHLGVVDLALARNAEEALGLEVGLEGFDLFLGAAGGLHEVHGHRIDREEAHGGAILRGHVGNGGAVGQGQGLGALAKKLDKLPNHLLLAQHLGDGEHKVGGRGALGQLAREVHTNDIGGEEVQGLAEHGRLGLNAAHAPAHHTNAIDHGGVAVRSHQGVGVADAVLGVHTAGEVLEVDLVHDANARGHDLEGIKGLHAPLHELVALLVALELKLHVEIKGIAAAEVVDHHRVVDDQVDRHQGLDALGVLAELVGHVAHGGEVCQQGHAGEVLEHHAGEHEWNLVGAVVIGLPARKLPNVGLGHLLAIAVAQHRLEHDANGHRQARHLGQASLFERRQGIELPRHATGGLV